jgi:hypothetical protein
MQFTTCSVRVARGDCCRTIFLRGKPFIFITGGFAEPDCGHRFITICELAAQQEVAPI